MDRQSIQPFPRRLELFPVPTTAHSYSEKVDRTKVIQSPTVLFLEQTVQEALPCRKPATNYSLHARCSPGIKGVIWTAALASRHAVSDPVLRKSHSPQLTSIDLDRKLFIPTNATACGSGDCADFLVRACMHRNTGPFMP